MATTLTMKMRAVLTMRMATTIVVMVFLIETSRCHVEDELEAEVEILSVEKVQRSEWAPSGMPRSQTARA
jgi:hypothetical protein